MMRPALKMNPPSPEDLVHLEKNYQAALDSVNEIKWTEEFPDYPESVVHFMCYILGSVWVNRDYEVTHDRPITLIDEPSTVAEIQSSLTALARSERISTGSWKQTIETDRVRPLIDRARQIMTE